MLNRIIKCSLIFAVAVIANLMTVIPSAAYADRINIRLNDDGYDNRYYDGYDRRYYRHHHRRRYMREECRWVPGYYGRHGRWHPAHKECTQVRYR